MAKEHFRQKIHKTWPPPKVTENKFKAKWSEIAPLKKMDLGNKLYLCTVSGITGHDFIILGAHNMPSYPVGLYKKHEEWGDQPCTTPPVPMDYATTVGFRSGEPDGPSASSASSAKKLAQGIHSKSNIECDDGTFDPNEMLECWEWGMPSTCYRQIIKLVAEHFATRPYQVSKGLFTRDTTGTASSRLPQKCEGDLSNTSSSNVFNYMPTRKTKGVVCWHFTKVFKLYACTCYFPRKDQRDSRCPQSCLDAD